jgi:hypothetical protein
MAILLDIDEMKKSSLKISFMSAKKGKKNKPQGDNYREKHYTGLVAYATR